MADLPDPSASSPLLKAAERMERMMRAAKKKQIAEAGGRLLPDAPVAPCPDPGKDWARKYAVRAIRRVAEPADAPPLPQFAPLANDAEAAPEPRAPAPPVLAAPQKTRENTGHIGASLGKPPPRRSWVGRLFPSR